MIKNKTPKLLIKKKMVDDINTVPTLIFLADIPNKVIKIKAP